MTELSVQTSSFTSHPLHEYIIYDNILLHNHSLSADLPNLTDQQLDKGLTSHSLPLQALYLSAQHGTFLLSCDFASGFPKCMDLRQSVCSPQTKHREELCLVGNVPPSASPLWSTSRHSVQMYWIEYTERAKNRGMHHFFNCRTCLI